MKARMQITIETDVGPYVEEMACWERPAHRLEDIGPTLAESKRLLAAIQKILVEQQVTEYLEARRGCPHGGQSRGKKGSPTVSLQTLFGDFKIDSPRWSPCPCQPDPEKTLSPVAEWLSERVSPERLYGKTKWGSRICWNWQPSCSRHAAGRRNRY
jgi:hypothetical protein